MSHRAKQHWGLMAASNAARVKSDLTLNTAGVVRRTTADSRPGAIVFAFGYSF